MNKKLDHSSTKLGMKASTALRLKIVSQLEAKKAEGKSLYLQVKILPESAKNEIVEELENGAYKIRIAAPPVDGRANKELCRFLRKQLGASEVNVISGSREKTKLVKIM